MTRLSRAAERDMKNRPHICALVNRFTQEAIAAGFTHYTISGIFERIRWHINVESRDESGLKLNNNHRAYYARWWMKHYDSPGYFRTRIVRGGDRPPTLQQAVTARLREELGLD